MILGDFFSWILGLKKDVNLSILLLQIAVLGALNAVLYSGKLSQKCSWKKHVLLIHHSEGSALTYANTK